jgi:hypothetical protein
MNSQNNHFFKCHLMSFPMLIIVTQQSKLTNLSMYVSMDIYLEIYIDIYYRLDILVSELKA